MLHKSYKDNLETIDKLTLHVKGLPDSTAALAFIDEFQNWAEQNNDPQLVWEAEMLRTYCYTRYQGAKSQTKTHYYAVLAKKGKEENNPIIEVRAVMNIANYCWAKQEFQDAFKWFMRCVPILDKIDAADFPKMAAYLNNVGNAYYYFQDYQNAMIYFKKSSSLNRTTHNSSDVFSGRNTLGLCYQKMGQFELSNQLFTKTIEDTSQYQSPVWKAISSGNLGYNYYLQGNYEAAIPLLKTDIEFALKPTIGVVDYGLAAGSTIPLADIYLKKNQLEKSKQEIEAAQEYIRLSKQTDRLRKLYPIMSRWFARNNHYDSSEAYLDLSIMADQNYNEKYNSLKLMRAGQEFQAREREFEVSQLKMESQLKLAKRNLLSGITVILLIVTLLVFWFRNKYFLKKQEIKDLALVNTQEALVHAKSQLGNLVQRVNQNNEVINQLKKGNPQKTDLDLLERLKSTSILTEDDWNKYKEIC